MKTTLEIPDAIFRRAKTVAAERGIPFRALVSEALSDKLRAQGDRDSKPWMKTFGKLRHLHKETARITGNCVGRITIWNSAITRPAALRTMVNRNDLQPANTRCE